MRRTPGLLAVALLLAGLAALAGPVPSAQASGPDVSLAVVDVSPNTPSVSTKPQPLTFTLEITNHAPDPIDVEITASRSDPIGSQRQLDDVLSRPPRTPSPDLVSPLTANASKTVQPDQTVAVQLQTTTDVFPHDGVCLCRTAIYPFFFTGTYTGKSESGIATAQTYVPAFATTPRTKSTVSWVWPLLDRPHRLLRSGVFFDDGLASEVARGGRLNRLLQVVQQVSAKVPMTIVTDPDLIDELAEMARGYKVVTPGGLVPGTGAAAAGQWLDQLRHVLTTYPSVKLVFTPFADPAVDSLSRAGMTWSVPPLDLRARAMVSAALGKRAPLTDVAWPVGRSLNQKTLDTLVSQGAKTVIVSDHAIGSGQPTPTTDALATQGSATLAVTSAPIQDLVGKVLDSARNGLALLPQLVAQLAVRVIDPNVGAHYVVITPPRRLDVNVNTAVRTIEATADTTWSRPMTIEDAVRSNAIVRTPHVEIRPGVLPPQLPPRLLRILSHVGNELPQLTSLFHDPAQANALSAPFPAAIQRCESSSLIGDRQTAFAMADRLRHIVTSTQAGVYLVRPSDGTYTLTSKNSYLPITVVNKLNAEVEVQISVNTVAGVPGLTADTSNTTYPIKPQSRVQEKILTHVDRVGLIRVVVRISTPTGLRLGQPIRLSVRSTALGTIGVVITVLAAIVLAAAVVIRTVRRVRKRRGPGPDEAAPARVPAATGR